MNRTLKEQIMEKLGTIEFPDGYVTDNRQPVITMNIPDLPGNSRGHALVKMFLASEWAILPEKLEQLQEVLQQHIAGTNLQIDYTPDMATTIRNSVAVIPITGTIIKRAYGLAAMSGVRGTVDIQQSIQEAIDNPAISGIVLRIDSPGGTVDGTKELADYIASAKSKKPIIAYADGTMASAAYWIGSAATKIVAFDTAKLGSVGVVVAHQEAGELYKKLGVKTTYIYQGKYKVVGNPTEPLSAEGKAYIQDHVDTYYGMFVDAIAENRNIERDVVIKDIALGAVFIGNNAVKLNLADSVGNLDDAILQAHKLGEEKMNIEQLEAKVSELTEQVTSLTSQLEAAQATNTQLTEQLETAQADIAEREKQEAATKRLAHVTQMFADVKVSEGFVASIVNLDDAVLASMHKELFAAKKAKASELAEFTSVTTDATTQGGDSIEPTTVDEATAFIEQRDNCDVEEAIEKAQVEFPKLFVTE